MAEGARLESVYTRKRIEGSNPSLTAILRQQMNWSAASKTAIGSNSGGYPSTCYSDCRFLFESH